MQRYLFLIVPFSILFFIDFYGFQAIKTAFNNKWLNYAYWALAIFAYLLFLTAVFTRFEGWPTNIRTYLVATILIFYVAKLFLGIFMAVEDVSRIIRWGIGLFLTSNAAEGTRNIGRVKFISQLGVLVASVPFIAMFNGMIRNAYNYQVKRVKLPIKNLPKAFHGFTISQISDFHTGSFMSPKPVEKVVQLINKLDSDAVFFTGDLVNNLASELQPYVELIANMKAKQGIYSVTGNHDYGDYKKWENPADKKANFDLFKDSQRRMGWNLLLNDNHIIEKDGERLAIIGVENISGRSRYHAYGDLDKAYNGCEDCAVKLLLSHDPSFWRAGVLEKFPDIDATFSGHTHGFQFGVNLPFFKWSPAKMAYPEWIGLYKEKEQYLYVNPGLGFVGYPGRVGFLPEVTVFELVEDV